MKKLLISGILLALVIYGCNQGSNNGGKSTQDPGNSIAVYLNEESFREKVYNYKENKEWKYEGTKPAIVDFYADWCAPCRELSPRLEEVAAEYGDKIILYKIDTVKERKLAKDLGIEALPTLMYIPVNGNPQFRMGLVSKESIKKAVDEILPGRTNIQ